MYRVVFYFCGINRAGSEIALLRYLKDTKKKDNIAVVYDKDASDASMIEEFKKIVEVKRINDNSIIETETAVNCMISSRENRFFDNIKANKRILWVQINPKRNGNYKDFERYDSFLGTSEYIKNIILEYSKLNNRKIYIANPIVDVEEIRRLSIEKQDAVNNNDTNLITIARITPNKGYNYIVEIAKKLSQRKISFKWYFLGFVSTKEEEYYKELTQRIKKEKLENNMIFLGVYENPYNILKNAHINILLSEEEAWGLAVTEAKALAVPSIASNNSALKEQIEDGVNGFLVDLPKTDEDYEKIVDKIENLIEDETLYNSVVENLKYYDIDVETIIKKMDECFYS